MTYLGGVVAAAAFALGILATPAGAARIPAGTAAVTPPPMVTITMSRSEISAADEALGRPAASCLRNDKNIEPMYALDATGAPTGLLPWLAANAPKVHLTGSIQTRNTDNVSTKGYWCAHYGESIAPSWSTLQSWAQPPYSMHFISHSADYPQQWTTVPSYWKGDLASWQDWETCGSRDDILSHGLTGAYGQFDWPNSITDPTVLASDVLPCFYMNRSYQGISYINTLESVTANSNIATTRQLLGGSCTEVVDPTNPCRNEIPDATWTYTPPRQIITMIGALQPGQDLNLQAYVLVRNTNPTYQSNQDRWDCRNSNPAYHWSNDAERYCWVDFQRIVTAIQSNPNVVVTDPEGVAVAWGMTPPSR